MGEGDFTQTKVHRNRAAKEETSKLPLSLLISHAWNNRFPVMCHIKQKSSPWDWTVTWPSFGINFPLRHQKYKNLNHYTYSNERAWKCGPLASLILKFDFV